MSAKYSQILKIRVTLAALVDGDKVCRRVCYVTVLPAPPLKSAHGEPVRNTVPVYSLVVLDVPVVHNRNSCSRLLFCSVTRRRRGSDTSNIFGRNFTRSLTNPRNRCTDCTSIGLGISWMALTFSGLGLSPSFVSRCPM